MNDIEKELLAMEIESRIRDNQVDWSKVFLYGAIIYLIIRIIL